ncbi:RDD family protein [Erythrobacter sp. HKB08]|uniref:RDD family protein n=1 Tax=Erythrobacter sp. HKB08 TaxID=2502843 RepID=UPI001008BBB5|nr:RDD family protein [Erythrobacter sp. HKB08]
MTSAVAPHLAYKVKRQRRIVTPEGIALPITVGARGARAGALIIDYIILLVTTVAVTLGLIFIANGLGLDGTMRDMNGAEEFMIIVISVFWFLAWNGYFMAFELGPRGATPGKRAVGLRVASRDGGRLTPEAVIARNLLRDIELFLPLFLIFLAPTGEGGAAGWGALLWFLVFMLFPFFNRDAMRAGDLIAGTWVVEAPKAKLAEALSTSGAAAQGTSRITGAEYKFGEEELSVYGEYELQTLERVLRDDRQESIEAVAETICRKIGWNPGSGDERAFLEAFYSQLRARLEGDMRFGKRKADKYS